MQSKAKYLLLLLNINFGVTFQNDLAVIRDESIKCVFLLTRGHKCPGIVPYNFKNYIFYFPK